MTQVVKTTSDKSPRSVVKPPRYVTSPDREVSSHCTTSSSSIVDRSWGAISKVKTSSIGSMGERVSVRQVWQVKIGVDVFDVSLDTQGSGWWGRNITTELCKYDMNGDCSDYYKEGDA